MIPMKRSKVTTYKKTSNYNPVTFSYNYVSNASDPRTCIYCVSCKKTVDEKLKCYVEGIAFAPNSKVAILEKNICSRCRMALC
jgi:hypothetical protein